MGSLAFNGVNLDSSNYNLDSGLGATPVDWAVFGGGSTTPTQRLNGGGSTISASLIGGAPSNVTEARTISWSNGTPTGSGSSTDDLFNSTFSSGNGIALTFPADTTARRAYILCAAYTTVTAQVDASLSDASATPISQTWSGPDGAFNYTLITIDYTANSSSQTLTVNLTTTGAATVTLQAAAHALTAAPATLDQTEYRFRNDDGNETAATWAASQNTGITKAISDALRLRIGLQATGDPATFVRQFEYRLNPSGSWRALATSQPSTSIPTFVAAGTVASGTATVSPGMPAGIATNDILLMFAESANEAISISASGGGTWTEDSNSPQGTGTAAGTSATRLAVYWSRYDGSQTAPTLADSGNHTVGRILAFRGCIASGSPFDVSAGATDGTSNTSGSVPGATTTTDNCLIVGAIANSFDPAANDTAEFSGWTNGALSSVTELTDDGRSAGNGGCIGTFSGGLASHGTYGSTSVTLANAGVKASWSGALKPLAVTSHAILLSASANIASSAATATTSQLTGLTGTFTAGNISDDTNPLPTADIGNDGNIEDEVSITITSFATNGDVYDFRVTNNGTALAAYTVTPQLTIGSGAITLTGQASTSAKGSLTPADSVTSTGQAATTNGGSFGVASTVAQTGQGATASRGTATPTISVSLSGLSVTSAQGTLSPPGGITLTGLAGTISLGTLTPNLTLTAAGSLQGQSSSSAEGQLTPAAIIALTGAGLTSSRGTLSGVVSRALTGQSVTPATGQPSPSATVPVTGQGATSAGGTLAAFSGQSAALTGLSVTASGGTPAPVHLLSLTGQASTFAEGQLSIVGAIQEYVPYLIGDTLEAALMRIASIYCVPDVTGSTGTVTLQSPDHMTLVSRGSTISIILGGPLYTGSGGNSRARAPYGSPDKAYWPRRRKR